MKKYGAIVTAAFAAALGLLLLSACANPFTSPAKQDPANRGKGLVRIGTGVGAARTALPDFVFDHYEYLFSEEGGEANQTISPTESGGSVFELSSGRWTVTVSAYATPGDNSPAAEGSAPVEVYAGEDTAVTVILIPRTSEGEGTLNYSLAIPTGATVTSFTLLSDDATINLATGATITTTSYTGTETVDAGYYIARAVLRKNGITVAKYEVVHIYDALTTPLTLTFTNDDFLAILVTSNANNGDGSLRQAIQNAQAGATIMLDLPAGEEIVLTSTLTIGQNLTIYGGGATLTQQGFTGSLISISTNRNITLRRLHFTGGSASSGGGAIYAGAGSITTIESCVFNNNQDVSQGGALLSLGTVTVRGSTFYNNSATSGSAVWGRNITLTGNLFYGNAGNVVYTSGTYTRSYTYNAADSDFWDGISGSSGNRLLSSQPMSPVNFKLAGGLGSGGAENMIPAKPANYPDQDFYGAPVPDEDLAAGAAQEVITGRFLLGYGPQGPGAVQRIEGAPESDGFYIPGSAVTLKALPDSNKQLLHWTVDGDPLVAPPDPPDELPLTMNGHKTVRAVFIGMVRVVNTDADEGAGSLRAALAIASEGDRIELASNYTITLLTPLPYITVQDLVIAGNGSTLVQGYTAGNNRLLTITATGEARISRLHFKGARSTINGAAIYNQGTLILESCIFSDNRTESGGGAIYTAGSTASLSVYACTFYGNEAERGGAIYHPSGTLSLTGNIFWGNRATRDGPAVRSDTTETGGYNVSDLESGYTTDNSDTTHSGWTFGNRDIQSTSLPMHPVNFKPYTGDLAEGRINAVIQDYPGFDFNGNPIPSGAAAAGAVQTTMTKTGYLLDYGALGAGQVDVVESPDQDGLYSGTVTLTATADGNGTFLGWTVNGADPGPQDPPNELTLTGAMTAGGNVVVRALFITTWTVSSTENAGAGSLRQALADANDGDTINLPAGGVTITLASSLSINKSLTINGNGATLTSSMSAYTDTYLLSIPNNAANLTLAINRLHFKGGRTRNLDFSNPGYAAAICHQGSGVAMLSLESCIFSDNQNDPDWKDAHGGAVYFSGATAGSALTVSGCTFYGNKAINKYDKGIGGAIYVASSGANLTLTGNIFVGNTAKTSNPVVYHPDSNYVSTGGYNVSDKADGYATSGLTLSGWDFGSGDTQLTDTEFDATTFEPYSVTGLPAVPSGLLDFPALYFDGSPRDGGVSGNPGSPGAMSALMAPPQQ